MLATNGRSCVCVHACVRMCVRACLRACVCVFAVHVLFVRDVPMLGQVKCCLQGSDSCIVHSECRTSIGDVVGSSDTSTA